MRARVSRIGVISDTHGILRPEALAALEGCEFILHAGDVGSPNVLDVLTSIAPVTVVRGNNDRGPWADSIPETAVVEIAGVVLFMTHDLKTMDVDPRERGFAAVIAGHSHRPSCETKDGLLFFNPGSAGPRRFKLPITVGRLLVRAGRVQGEIVTLSLS
jgi:putative phosphoesterase